MTKKDYLYVLAFVIFQMIPIILHLCGVVFFELLNWWELFIPTWIYLGLAIPAIIIDNREWFTGKSKPKL